jgi:hypothetical protein
MFGWAFEIVNKSFIVLGLQQKLGNHSDDVGIPIEGLQ